MQNNKDNSKQKQTDARGTNSQSKENLVLHTAGGEMPNVKNASQQSKIGSKDVNGKKDMTSKR